MREILFRGKDLRGNWYFGYYIFEPQTLFHYIVGFNEEHLVNPFTVGQYTGLKDKNGTKIFEGDILKNLETGYIGYVDYEWHGCPNFVIKSNDGAFGFKTLFIELPDLDMEIIGNMSDNKDLLKIYPDDEYKNFFL